MVLLKIEYKAELEGLSRLLCGGSKFNFKVSCSSCNMEHSNIWIFRDEEYPLPGSRGTAHLVMKCKSCNRDMSCALISSNNNNNNNDGYLLISSLFDCRGMTIIEWLPSDDFYAYGLTDTRFDDIDLSNSTDNEFYDYDEDNECPVSIQGFQSRIFKTKL